MRQFLTVPIEFQVCMEALFIFLGVIFVLFIIYVGITVSLFRFAILRKDDVEKKDRWLFKKPGFSLHGDKGKDAVRQFEIAPFETVTITSFDGIKLSAFLLPAENPKGTVILFHGFHSTPKWDFAASFPYFSALGMNLLYPIQRAHGISEGKFITYGIKERKDAVAWTEFVNGRYGVEKPLYLGGISMGCTTVLMGSGEGYPKNVQGIIADCGFLSPHGIFTEVMRKSGLPPAPFVWLFGILCKRIAGFDIDEYSVFEALKHTDIPIAFIHGEHDRLIPCKMTLRAHDSYKGKKFLLTVKNATHGVAYLHGKAEYEAVLKLLFN